MIEGWQVFLSRLHNNYQLFGAAFSSTNTSWELVRKAGDTRDGSNQGCFKPFYTPPAANYTTHSNCFQVHF